MAEVCEDVWVVNPEPNSLLCGQRAEALLKENEMKSFSKLFLVGASIFILMLLMPGSIFWQRATCPRLGLSWSGLWSRVTWVWSLSACFGSKTGGKSADIRVASVADSVSIAVQPPWFTPGRLFNFLIGM